MQPMSWLDSLIFPQSLNRFISFWRSIVLTNSWPHIRILCAYHCIDILPPPRPPTSQVAKTSPLQMGNSSRIGTKSLDCTAHLFKSICWQTYVKSNHRKRRGGYFSATAAAPLSKAPPTQLKRRSSLCRPFFPITSARLHACAFYFCGAQRHNME